MDSSSTDCAQTDQQLAEVIDQITDEIRSGQSPSLAEYQRRFPDLADQLRQLFPTLGMLGKLSGATDHTIAETSEPAPNIIGQWAHQLGDFQIIGEIGRGGMGIVYEARQLSLDRRVALKVLPFAAMLNARQLARFKTEARAAAGLHHAGIVPVYSVSSDRGVHYYAMQYIDGQSLAAAIESIRDHLPASLVNRFDGRDSSHPRHRSRDTTAPPLTSSTLLGSTKGERPSDYFRAVADIGIQAAEALEHAHQNGVIHRDIKPGNLMLDLDGKLWVTDFGLARVEQNSELTMTGDLIGTLRYMSPEQATSPHSGTDHRCDIYSLGATLYELLTLRPAFQSEQREETLRQIRLRDPVSPCRINRNVPADLETIVLKAMEKDPGGRYQTAEALADDLRCYLQDRTISAKRPTPVARVRKWGRRHPAVVNSAVIILLLGTVGSALSTVLVLTEQSQTKAALASAERNFRQSEAHRLFAESATAQSVNLLYVRGLGLAARALQDGDSAAAAALMKSNPADSERTELRGFEWHYLNKVLAPRHKTLVQGTAEFLSTAWSIDGRFFAAADSRGSIQLWQTGPDRQIATLEGHRAAVNGLAFDPNSQTLASVSADGSLRTWEIPSGRERATVVDCHQGSGVFSVAFSHDGGTIATGGADTTARIWDSRSLRSVATLQGHTRDIRSVAFAPDDQTIATASNDRTVKLWDANTHAQQRTLSGHTGMVLCVTFSKSGKSVISGSNDQTIRFWDRESGAVAAVIDGHHDGVQSIAALPDGQRIVAADRSGQIRIWNIRGRREIDRFEGASIDGLQAVRLSRDGRCWAGLTESGRLLIRDLSTKRTTEVPFNTSGQSPTAVSTDYPISDRQRIAFSPDGLRLYCAGRILQRSSLDQFTWESIQILDNQSSGPGCFSPDGKILATGWDSTIRLWDPSDASAIFEFDVPAGYLAGLRFSPDGAQLAAWFRGDWKLVLWDVKHRTVLPTIELADSHAIDLEYSPGGDRFATCSASGKVRIWDRSGTELSLLNIGPRRAETIAWLYGGSALAVGIPGQETAIHWLDNSPVVETVGTNQRVWDLRSSDRHGLLLAHDFAWGAVVYDLNQLAISSDVVDGLQGHDDRVWSVSVSPDGRSIISGSRDGSLRRWTGPMDRWHWLERRPHHDDLIQDFAFSSDAGKLLLARKQVCSVFNWPSGEPPSETHWNESARTNHAGFGFESESIAIDPKGRWIATGHDDGTVKVWESSTTDPVKNFVCSPVGTGVPAVAFSPDGSFLACCSHLNNSANLYRTDSWSELFSVPADDCDDIAFSPDSDWLAYCDGREAVLQHLKDPAMIRRLSGHSITVHGVAFSPDASLVVTACEDRKLRIWRVADGSLLEMLNGHAATIRRVTFSRDGTTLVSGGSDGAIKLWHVETGQELYTLARLEFPIEQLTFSPDGMALLVLTDDGRMHVFDAGRPEIPDAL